MTTQTIRSRQVFQTLLAGEEVRANGFGLTLPQTEEADAVLRGLMQRIAEERTRATDDEARLLVDEVAGPAAVSDDEDARLSAPVCEDAPAQDAPIQHLPPRWRLHRLSARNYRGLTDWEQPDDFVCDFAGKPHHIFGLNGSGKTSIIGAIVWCLSGVCLRERDEPVDAIRGVDIHGDDALQTRTHSRWPEIVTLPYGSAATATASAQAYCWVETQLRSSGDELVVRREYDGTGRTTACKALLNGSPIADLGEVGISGLACELALLMPNRVSAIQFAAGSRLSSNLMEASGLTPVQAVGELAAGLAKAVSRLQNAREQGAVSALATVRQSMQEAADHETIDPGLRDPITMTARTLETQPTAKVVADAAQSCRDSASAVSSHASTRWQDLADALGLPADVAQQSDRTQIARSVEKARVLIGDGPASQWPPFSTWSSCRGPAAIAESALGQWAHAVRSELSQLWVRWLQNAESRGKLALKIRAAQQMAETQRWDECPVCDQALPEQAQTQLRDLMDQQVADDDRVVRFVEEQIAKLENGLPQELERLPTQAPVEQLRATLDSHIVKRLAGLASIENSARDASDALSARLPAFEAPSVPSIMPEDAGGTAFATLTSKLDARLAQEQARLAAARWGREHGPAVAAAVEDLRGRTCARLDELSGTARGYEDLVELAEVLERIATDCDTQAETLRWVAVAAAVHDVLGGLKQLSRYASTALEADVTSVAKSMSEYYGLLYPNDHVALAGLADCGKPGKPDYRCMLRFDEGLFVDADPVANAGRVRGILWSYTFALIEREEPALALIVVDDPYLSLDDYAAENMIVDVLGRKLASSRQVISTVHEKHHLDPVWPADALQEEFGVVHVLPRDAGHRHCRCQPFWDPLRVAIQGFEEDKAQFEPVLAAARVYLETSLKLAATYVLGADCSTKDGSDIACSLRALVNHETGAKPLGIRVRSEVRQLLKSLKADLNEAGPVFPNGALVLHALHHGSPGTASPHPDHAAKVAVFYPDWCAAFHDVFLAIDQQVARSRESALVAALGVAAPSRAAMPEIRPAELLEVGRAAAAGSVSTEALDAEPVAKHCFGDARLEAAVVVTDLCKPVIEAGHTVLLAADIAVKSGDLALVWVGSDAFLRRVFEVPLDDTSCTGWLGQTVSPVVRTVPPVVVRPDDVVLSKVVGVLYSPSSAASDVSTAHGEVGPPRARPRVLAQLEAGKLQLVEVKGDSAEPVALQGQFLLVDENAPDALPEDQFCCVDLGDGQRVFKRLVVSRADPSRVMLQPVSPLAGHATIEALAAHRDEDEGDAGSHMPAIREVRVVRGVLFAAPEELAG